MYIPEAFAENDRQEITAMIQSIGLATLVTSTADGLMATPLPMYFRENESELGVLHGHIARANTQWQHPAIGDAMVIFQGVNAYVTPNWYPSKAENGRVVPTWNYIAVHAYGPVEFYDDPKRLLENVTALTNRFESKRANGWSVDDAPREYIEAQLRGIVGVRVPVRRFDAKKKLSQNRSAIDRAGVKAGLRERDESDDRAISEIIPD
jgi:transcriptional regulator